MKRKAIRLYGEEGASFMQAMNDLYQVGRSLNGITYTCLIAVMAIRRIRFM